MALQDDENHKSVDVLARRLLALRQPAAGWQIAAPFGMPAQQVPLRRAAVTMQAPATAKPPLRRVSRRSALASALPVALAALAAPRLALAKTKCDCSGGLDSCVCTEVTEEDKLADNYLGNRIGPLTEANNADYAASDKIRGVEKKTKSNSIWFGNALESTEPSKKPRFLVTQTVDYNPDLGNTKTYYQIEAERGDPTIAKAKFAKLVALTVAQREKELGVTFSDEDIAQLADALKPAYCGRQAQFGKC